MSELFHKDQRLSDAMAEVSETVAAVAVVDESSRVCGVIGDYEIRRELASDTPANAPLHTVWSTNFLLAAADQSSTSLQSDLIASDADYVVQLNTKGDEARVLARSECTPSGASIDHAVLMVGGEGARLKPLTNSIPKPMLLIGDKPLLQRIVEHAIRHGVGRITMALGYLGEQIVSHFGDGSSFGIDIDYVHEEKPMGTAGALGMIDRDPDQPLLVMNGDVLTDLNISAMANAHHTEGAALTVATRVHRHEIPFGVFRLINGRVVAVEEKPTHRSWTNAGVYMMEPTVLDLIPRNEYSDMTLLLENLIRRGDVVQSFCLWEFWIDIGRPKDYERANRDLA